MYIIRAKKCFDIHKNIYLFNNLFTLNVVYFYLINLLLEKIPDTDKIEKNTELLYANHFCFCKFYFLKTCQFVLT